MEPSIALWHFDGNWAIWLIVTLMCLWACTARTAIWWRMRKDPKAAKSNAFKAIRAATLACWSIWILFPCILILYCSGISYLNDAGCKVSWAVLVFVWMIGNDALYFFLRGKCFVTNAMNKDQSFLKQMKFLKYYLYFYQVMAIGAAASSAARSSLMESGECSVVLSPITVPILILTDLVVKVVLLFAFLKPVREQYQKRRLSRKNKVAPTDKAGEPGAKNPMSQHMKTIKRNVYTTGVSVLSTEGLLFGLLAYNLLLDQGPLGYLIFGGVISGFLNVVCLCLCFKATDLHPAFAFGFKKEVKKQGTKSDKKMSVQFGSSK